jgi:hypothetical protein
MTKQYLLPVTFIVGIFIGLTACGGGGGSKGTNIIHKFDGTWKRACEYDSGKSRAEQATIRIDGNEMKVLYKQYLTQDCSGSAKLTADAIFNIQYKGTYATGDCIAEKVDATITGITVNDTKIPFNQISGLLTNIDFLSSPQYDLICIDEKGALRSGDTSEEKYDASTPEKRPIAMDMSGEGGIKQ